MNKAIYIIFILVFSLLIPGCGNEPGNASETYNLIKVNEPPTEDVPKTRVVLIKFAMESGSSEEVDKPLMLMGHRSLLHYPLAAARDKTEGHVVVRFVVDIDDDGTFGKGKDPEVVEADPEGVFEKSALTIIEQHQFTPATLNGEPVPYTVIMTVEYTLEGRLKSWINRLLGTPRLKKMIR